VLKALEAVGGLDIEMIAPSHGVIWRQHIPDILAAYTSWAKGETREKALIVYDTMWGSTEKMAHAILEGLVDGGVSARLYRLTISDNSDIVKELLDSRALVLGSPILNNNIFPTVAEFATYVKGLRPKGRIAGTFGSYGWGGGALKGLQEDLKSGGMDVMEGPQVQFVPDAASLTSCREWGRSIARAVMGT
jgi:flavorubredoxin